MSMFQLKSFLLPVKALLVGVTLSLSFPAPVFAADDYLSALEEEAGDTGAKSTRVSAQVSTPVKKAKHVGADKVLAEGLSFDEFEATLDSNYSGSNFLYTKLSRSKRKSVYKFYQNDNRISSVREEIVRLLSSG